MKRFLALMIVVLSCFCLWAGPNSQKIYQVDSLVYKNIQRLYIVSGRALPSTTGPWSGDELSKMIQRLDISEIPDSFKSLYQQTVDALELSSDDPSMTLGGYVDLESYVHSNDSGSITRTDVDGLQERAFAGRSWWFGKDLSKVVPLVSLDWETFLGDNFYTFFNVSLQNSCHGEEELGDTKLNFNIPVFQNAKVNARMLDVNFPSRAFFSFGGDGWSAEIGRDRASWGPGETGNLTLSDNFPYYDMARFTAYSDNFKYTYMLSFFPNKVNYYDNEQPGYCGTGFNDSTSTLKGVFFYVAHRFEGRLLKDRLTLAVTEALVYQSESSSIQFAAISPMYFMHNAYMPDNSNSTLDFELSYTPFSGLNLYGEFLLDQFAFPGFESSPGPERSSDTTTNGVGVLLGAKFVTTAGEGILEINPEFAYASSYVYLRDGETANYGMDYVGAVRNRLYSYEDLGLGTDIVYDDYVIGYTYGPDCIVGSLAASYEFGQFTFGADVLGILHGTNDIWTKWRKVPANMSEDDYKAYFKAPTTNGTDNWRFSDASSRNASWKTLDLGLRASYKPMESLELSCAVDFVSMSNIFNVLGNDANDFQLIIGAKYSF